MSQFMTYSHSAGVLTWAFFKLLVCFGVDQKADWTEIFLINGNSVFKKTSTYVWSHLERKEMKQIVIVRGMSEGITSKLKKGTQVFVASVVLQATNVCVYRHRHTTYRRFHGTQEYNNPASPGSQLYREMSTCANEITPFLYSTALLWRKVTPMSNNGEKELGNVMDMKVS